MHIAGAADWFFIHPKHGAQADKSPVHRAREGASYVPGWP